MITPINVKVENIGQDNCLFKMQCANCQTVISADAQMSKAKKVTLQQTASNQQKEPQTTKKPVVSLDDLMLIKKQLQNFPGSFNAFFQ